VSQAAPPFDIHSTSTGRRNRLARFWPVINWLPVEAEPVLAGGMTSSLRHSHAVYDYDGHCLTMMYVDDAIGIWEVYEGMSYLGIVVESHVGAYVRYAARSAGSRDIRKRLVMTDDWQSAVIYLVDAA
jgi:hypothetical protein